MHSNGVADAVAVHIVDVVHVVYVVDENVAHSPNNDLVPLFALFALIALTGLAGFGVVCDNYFVNYLQSCYSLEWSSCCYVTNLACVRVWGLEWHQNGSNYHYVFLLVRDPKKKQICIFQQKLKNSKTQININK